MRFLNNDHFHTKERVSGEGGGSSMGFSNSSFRTSRTQINSRVKSKTERLEEKINALEYEMATIKKNLKKNTSESKEVEF